MSLAPTAGRSGAWHPLDDRDQLARWRLISLEKQLPQPRLLTGVGTPALVTALLLALLAIFAFAYLGRNSSAGVPRAVVQSQQEFVKEISRGLNNSVRRSRDELTRTVEAYNARPDGVAAQLAALTKAQPKWRGVSVFAPDGKSAVAAVGQPVALPAGTAPSRAALPLVDGNDPRLLLVEPLADGRLLIAELALNLRTLRLDPRSKQAVLIAVPGGGRAMAQGVPVQAAPELDDLIAKVVGRTSRGSIATRSGGTATPLAGSGSPTPVVPLVTAHAVGELGVAIVSLVYTPATAAVATREPLVAAAVLLVAALAVLLVLQFGLVRPVRRLLSHAKAVASGNSSGEPPRTVNAQVNRIAVALSALADRQSPSAARRDLSVGGVPAGLVVVAAVLAVLAAGGGIMTGLTEIERYLPGQVIRDSENQAAAVAAALGDTLDGGYQKLVGVGRDKGTADTTELRSALDQLLDENHRFPRARQSRPGRCLAW